jgi:hypothetical protein
MNMGQAEITTALTLALEDADLHNTISSVLKLMAGGHTVRIVEGQPNIYEDRSHIIDIYRVRHKILSERNATVQGLQKTIHSLKKRTVPKIHLVLVQVGQQIITLWLDPSDRVIGCLFGKDQRELE